VRAGFVAELDDSYSPGDCGGDGLEHAAAGGHLGIGDEIERGDRNGESIGGTMAETPVSASMETGIGLSPPAADVRGARLANGRTLDFLPSRGARFGEECRHGNRSRNLWKSPPQRKHGDTAPSLSRSARQPGIPASWNCWPARISRAAVRAAAAAKRRTAAARRRRRRFPCDLRKMVRADIIVVGSPVYFGSATPELMALLDRAGYVGRCNGGLLSRKIGGPITVARRAGQNFTYAQLLFWYMINDMVVPGSSYWNVATARDPGAVNEDAEALRTIDRFADNLAWLAAKLR
jgi:hypothetical protein